MAAGLLGGGLVVASDGVAQDSSYQFYVASESDDVVTRLRFAAPDRLSVEKVIAVGSWPAENEAPHGLSVDPNGAHWYLTLGHGFPFGSLWKFAAGSDTAVAQAGLGLFPATVAVPSFGGIAFAVNSNFHGDHEPSTVSVVDLESMTEIAVTETCVMPHGSRFSPDGLRHYSACMMDDLLVEIDVASLDVTRRLAVGPGAHDPSAGRCSPTWAQPAGDGRTVYVACNRSHEVVEVDTEAWRVTRRFEAPGAPYNIAVSPDDRRLVVTHKGAGAVSVWDRVSGTQEAWIPSSRRVTHGVVISPDNRYAFVTVEGIGGEPGTVDVIDLATLRLVASCDVGKQAGGIAFWRTTAP